MRYISEKSVRIFLFLFLLWCVICRNAVCQSSTATPALSRAITAFVCNQSLWYAYKEGSIHHEFSAKYLKQSSIVHLEFEGDLLGLSGQQGETFIELAAVTPASYGAYSFQFVPEINRSRYALAKRHEFASQNNATILFRTGSCKESRYSSSSLRDEVVNGVVKSVIKAELALGHLVRTVVVPTFDVLSPYIYVYVPSMEKAYFVVLRSSNDPTGSNASHSGDYAIQPTSNFNFFKRIIDANLPQRVVR